MDLLLASLMMIWGTMTAGQPDLTLERLVEASISAREAIVRDASEIEAPIVKGIYSTAHSAGGSRFNELVQLIDDTALNAIVIDVKDDWGNITFLSENEELNAMGTSKPIIKDIRQVMQTLEEHDIYPIARVVVFKDTVLSHKKPEWSFLNASGAVWKNGRGESFVNPYIKEIWDYNVAVAKEAAKMGFKEIQFDYVRFPEGFEKRADQLTFAKDERSRIQVVSDFVKYAKEQLNPLGIKVSVDIFGYAASVPAAEGIGQDFVKISEHVNVICPMIYPSHYGPGWFGLNVPDAHPYETIRGAIEDTKEKLSELGENQPIIRPWIQDFTASWVRGHIRYGKKEVEAQIRALKELGVNEYLLWNASNRYTPGVDYQ